ncbi:uncharacterized protein LOC114579931 [Dendrobium catenatum]|uniref:uncharacterized protein LOC114579931 n=1 Tax=Dendrobium catenatum TaxID=906689 RepID=UPI00109F8292|nr:uncharacterized protein LOC114579931 [Dendrobium catenatum]
MLCCGCGMEKKARWGQFMDKRQRSDGDIAARLRKKDQLWMVVRNGGAQFQQDHVMRMGQWMMMMMMNMSYVHHTDMDGDSRWSVGPASLAKQALDCQGPTALSGIPNTNGYISPSPAPSNN